MRLSSQKLNWSEIRGLSVLGGGLQNGRWGHVIRWRRVPSCRTPNRKSESNNIPAEPARCAKPGCGLPLGPARAGCVSPAAVRHARPAGWSVTVLTVAWPVSAAFWLYLYHSPAGRESFQVCGGGGLGDGKLRRDAVVRLDLDEGQLACAALAEGGGGAVGGEHVGVAVTAEARDGRVRVVPGAGGKLGDPRAHRLIDGQAGQAGTPVVEDPHEVAVVQAAGCRVAGIQPHRLTPGDLDGLAVRADIQLAVEPGPRLVGDQLQTEAPGGGGAEPFVRFEPDRMARAVRGPEAVDGCREDFDLPGRRGERVALRVGAEVRERHLRLAGHRQFEAVACPELVKTRYRPAALNQVAPPLFIQAAQPVHRGAARGEVLARAQPVR